MKENINKHVMVKYGKPFREACEPIFKSTPINYIGLARLYKDGSRSYLISNPEWGKILLENQYHLAGTEDALIEGPQSSHQLWSLSSMFTLNKQTQNLFQDCISNNYGNGITLIEKGKDFVEFFHICADGGYENVNPFLSNNIPMLWNYILYIREVLSTNKELKKAYNIKYYYNSFPTSNYNTKNPSFMEIKKFYLGGFFDGIYFTPKEMQCLILLYKTWETKEIAKRLNLSIRTVEFYFENIRQKTSCPNKISLAIELSNNNLFKSIAENYIFDNKLVL